MKTFLREFKTAFLLTAVLVILVCGVYPLAVWAGAQALFPEKANGSLLIDQDGKVRGSRLIAQNFAGEKYFHSRPSAAGAGFDATNSSGTNLGPTSSKLTNGIHHTDTAGKSVSDPENFDGIKDLVSAYRSENSLSEHDSVPADAVTRSSSGLDPEISVMNAQLQIPRVAKARGVSAASVAALVRQNTNERDLGIFGESGVTVLTLNRALDEKGP